MSTPRIVLAFAGLVVVAGALSAFIGLVLLGDVRGSTTPSRAEIERFGRIQLPRSAREIDATKETASDERLKLRFVMDRGDVGAFARSAGLPLERGYKPYAAEELGWHLDRIRETLGGHQARPGYGRMLVIDLDRPRVATVYLIASTS